MWDAISILVALAALVVACAAWHRASNAEADVRMWRRVHANWMNGGRR